MRPVRSVDFAIFFVLLLVSFIGVVAVVLYQAGVDASFYETVRLSLRIIVTSVTP